MKYLKYVLLMAAFVISANQTNVFAQKNTVFGMEIGKPFTVKECPHQLFKKKDIVGKTYWALIYDEKPPATPCFIRAWLKGMEYYKKEVLPTLPFPSPQNIFGRILFPAGEKPALAVEEKIYAYISNDGNLHTVVFSFPKNNSQEMFDTLKNKYGSFTKKTPMRWQNNLGATYDYEIIEWSSPNLYIKFQSAGGFINPEANTFNEVTSYPFEDRNGMVSIGFPRQTNDGKKKIDL